MPKGVIFDTEVFVVISKSNHDACVFFMVKNHQKKEIAHVGRPFLILYFEHRKLKRDASYGKMIVPSAKLRKHNKNTGIDGLCF